MKFNSNNDPTSLNAIRDFEAHRGVRLPEDYTNFLLNLNGGQLNPNKSYAEIDGWNDLLVQELFGLTENPSHSISNHRFTNFEDYMHKIMLEIGYDPFGQALFMDLRETSHGRIYIRAHNSPPNAPILIDDADFEDEGDYEEASIFYPLANNWTEFAAMLGPAPPITE
jgi:hypothetical protein